MPAPEASVAHYEAQGKVVEATATLLGQVWSRVRFSALAQSWSEVSDLALIGVSAGQEAAAMLADPYLDAVIRETGIDGTPAGRVRPSAFSGLASDGRSLDSLLASPLVAVRTALSKGASRREAMTRGLHSLTRIGVTQVQDAGRTAVGAGIAARPEIVWWVRMLQLPSCARCAVLAGRRYRWSRGFDRHPFCDCIHVPVTEDTANDVRTNPRKAIESGQVTGLSVADTRAIVEDGADVSQVINAHRGMRTASVYGERLKTTTEGVTRRGVAGQAGRGRAAPRLRPESIYEIAEDRDDAIRLLRVHAYIT